MYVGFMTFCPKKGMMEKVLEILREIVRATENEEGFLGAYCLCDEKDYKILGIGEWKTKENADDFEKKRTPGDKISLLRRKLEEFLTYPMTREILSVPFMLRKEEGFVCCKCKSS